MLSDWIVVDHTEVTELPATVKACNVVALSVLHVRIITMRAVSHILLQQLQENLLEVVVEALLIFTMNLSAVWADLIFARRALVVGILLVGKDIITVWANV